MRDENKEVKITLSEYHLNILKLWAFLRSVPYSGLISTLIKEICEEEKERIESFIADRALQPPHNTSFHNLKSTILGIPETESISIALPPDTYESLLALAQAQGVSLEEYLQTIAKKKTK